MREFLRSKKITATTFVAMVFVTVGMYLVFDTRCFGNSCGSTAIRGLINPLIWFGIPASIISAFFLFFPQAIFVGFLKRIASWYLPILFLLTITTPIYSGHVMSIDRSQLVFAGMVVLALTAAGYAFWMRNKSVA